MRELLLSLRLLAVQQDQGNNLYLAARKIRDFMVRIPPSDVATTLEVIKSEVTKLMRSDERTSTLLSLVVEFLESQLNRTMD